eukprot:CAMPEP_0113400212 /NCGR_PEP_ID=MMETSP0013_2-20120614/15996_1 /TAXON_ID=2843 ORGANISM="Skeletonema costatum, Strain 1716" /NCGR_SAMPLE_ID=MMETSP0013_2 /ASSEMBLY_ACC=CAM_ASM_000158 /LENGTH=381 /DNA_ID=CAMNT_0000285253 /DNA_START=154 /DNA_END=1299 /DNA_ORIENTATION=+ /assembly_acc=CAM_ASM_000158
MEMESKSTSVTGDYIAHTDGSATEQTAVNFEDPRIKSLRLINALSYALTVMVSLGSIHTSVNDEYDDYEVWITNQTLLSVAPYTQYIWYILFLLQGLFIAASFLPSLWSSELLGYNVLAAQTGYKHPLPVVHYPALCASTLMMMYSAKLNLMSMAFLGSCASTYFLVSIIKYQLDNDTTPPEEETFGEITKWFQRRITPASTLQLDDVTSPDVTDEKTLKDRIQQYFFLKLPFELYAGFNLALNVSFLNIIVHKLIASAVFNLVLASASLLFLLGVGCYVSWTEKKGLSYGIGGGLAWYMFGVFFQLINPSAPIMMTYSEEAIDAAKYMSVIFANVLLSTVAIRAVKNAINVNVVRVDEMEDGLEDEEEEEDDVGAEYTQV